MTTESGPPEMRRRRSSRRPATSIGGASRARPATRSGACRRACAKLSRAVAREFAFHVALLDRAAFVPDLLAAHQAEFELDDAALEVQPERDEREALFVGAADEALELFAVQQQFARAVPARD